MSTTLARRIRRIGLLPSTKDEKGLRVHNADPSITPEQKAQIAVSFRNEAKAKRVARRGKTGAK